MDRMAMYRFYLLFIFVVIPHQLFAMPKAIREIVRIFEGKDKKHKKSVGPAGQVAKLPPSSLVTATPGITAGDLVEAVILPNVNNQQKESLSEECKLSDVEKARYAIDEAIKDGKLSNHPATWYYRGVIYDRLLREHILSEEAANFLNKTLEAYEQAKKLTLPDTQFHSFSLVNIASLWHYYLDRGIGYYKEEAFDQAVAHFSICRRILPQEPTPLLYIAITYHCNHKPEEALRCYESYLDDKGPVVAVFRAMANVQYHQLKSFDQAVSLLDKGLVLFPCNDELLEEKCLIYKDSGKTGDYQSYLLSAIVISNKAIDFYYAYAYLLENQGRIDEAIDYYQQILQVDPGHDNALRQISFIFYNQAIKAYAFSTELLRQKKQLEDYGVTDYYPLIGIRAIHRFAYPLGFSGKHLMLSAPFLLGTHHVMRLFFYSNGFLLHSYPFSQCSWGFPISDMLLYGYLNKKISVDLLHSRWFKTILEVENYLKKSLHYLKMARAKDRGDKAIAQALYYSYYYLKKYRSAYRLLGTMRKQKHHISREDNPFFIEKEKE